MSGQLVFMTAIPSSLEVHHTVAGRRTTLMMHAKLIALCNHLGNPGVAAQEFTGQHRYARPRTSKSGMQNPPWGVWVTYARCGV